MEINLPPEQLQQLAALASLHGFSSPEDYASTIILNVVEQDAFAKLPPDELAKSVQSIERGVADAEAGRSQIASQAMDDIAEKFGLTIPR